MASAREESINSVTNPQPNIIEQNKNDVSDIRIEIVPSNPTQSNYVENAQTETTPLLEEGLQRVYGEPLARDLPLETNRGWLRWAGNGIYNGAVQVKDAAVHTITHPIATILGLGTSAQSVVSAVANASHTDPKDIDSKWWGSLATGTKVQSIITFIFSLYVNFPVNKKFIEDAWSKLKTNSKDTFKSFGDFIDNVSSIFLGLNSGMAAAAITLEAFIWITTGGILIPVILAALSFLMAGTSRYMGNKRVFSMLKTFFSHDAKMQKQSIDALKHLKMDLKLQLNDTLQSIKDILQNLLNQQTNTILQAKRQLEEKDLAALEHMREKERLRIAKSKSISVLDLNSNDKAEIENLISQKASEILIAKYRLTDDDYELLFKSLITKLAELEALHPKNLDTNLYNDKAIREYLVEYSGTLVKLGLAIACGVSSGAVYMQKGFDAVNIVSKYAGHDLKDLDIWIKRLIGSSSGLASGLLYAASAADFPSLFFVTLPTYLYNHPKQICAALFLLVANYYASASMQSVSTGVVSRKDHILGMLAEGQMKEILPVAVRVGCGFVNIIAELKKYSPAPLNPEQPTVSEIVHHFEDPNHHRIQHDTALACSIANNKLSFFQKPTAKAPAKDPHDLQHTANNILHI